MTIQLFKWMMALAIMIYLPVLFERVRKIRKTDTRRSAEYIKQRIESIYFDVTHFYNQLGSLRQDLGTEPETWPDFDRLYCTEAWNAAISALPSDSGLFTRNYWLCSSELGFLYANKVEVIDFTGDQGTVSLTVHNGDLAMPVLLNIVFERGDWYIDNMTYNWNIRPNIDYFDWRQEMENSLAKTMPE